MDIIVNGRAIAAPHIEGDTWLSNPRRAPHVTDGNARDADEAVAFLWHTTSGRLVTELQAGKLPRWGLWLLCLLYIVPGLIGRDPWRFDDAAGRLHRQLQNLLVRTH